ncbi:MAG: hypothetical protein J7641_09475 [Cyanobacteria bacterium SID2]|nr:hypothetical protein [Cyanobacteria bacterium SID2]MBP0005671.1 hypothetical protein [Cyanobacteria bacterium SBC]
MGTPPTISTLDRAAFTNRAISYETDVLFEGVSMDVKTILLAITPVFVLACLFFGTQNGFYNTDNYHGNGSAH